ncbi:hypothetical protein [Sphingobium yanoikuyae]|jgi:hypothetical protein|uniref:hypothetical protein n=1 Tax=Sphingobium TaxID=165695 RepID=UPI0013768F7B|nr:hypothetical protein [Sphingobium yanoikuyae]NBB41708.1 hypothetical protein [Sphingobium yanoikuyae]
MAENHRVATDLRNLFGSQAGSRRTLAEISRDLYKRSVLTNRQAARDGAFDLMWDYEARGYVENSPGPRGGAGWKLSTKGAVLVERFHGPDGKE